MKEKIRKLFPRSVRRHRILGGPLKGSTIVTSWHDYPAAILGRTEGELLQWFDKNVHQGETWLDVGAHYGYTAMALCRLVGRPGRVFAFEPMLNTAGCLSRIRTLNNLPQLTVIPMALGDCADVATDSLHSVQGMIDSTLQTTAAVKTPLLVGRFDWLWPKISGSNLHIDGVKIDVQGMEINVLDGMADAAMRYKPKLLVELHKGVSRPKLLDIMTSIGYIPRGTPIDPLPGESTPIYADDRTYLFTPGVKRNGDDLV
jgi:FkbM family methyltransferase